MEQLISQASSYLEKRYKKPVHTVAAALETKDGKVYLGFNSLHFSGFVCAEMSVLASSMNDGETEFARIVAVRKDSSGSIVVANPCGQCRQILYDYTPGIEIVVADQDTVMMQSIEDLLPFAYHRTREKIQYSLTHDMSHEEKQ